MVPSPYFNQVETLRVWKIRGMRRRVDLVNSKLAFSHNILGTDPHPEVKKTDAHSRPVPPLWANRALPYLTKILTFLENFALHRISPRKAKNDKLTPQFFEIQKKKSQNSKNPKKRAEIPKNQKKRAKFLEIRKQLSIFLKM